MLQLSFCYQCSDYTSRKIFKTGGFFSGPPRGPLTLPPFWFANPFNDAMMVPHQVTRPLARDSCGFDRIVFCFVSGYSFDTKVRPNKAFCRISGVPPVLLAGTQLGLRSEYARASVFPVPYHKLIVT